MVCLHHLPALPVPLGCGGVLQGNFKEIKQILQLVDFLGHDENAVRWQIWPPCWPTCCCASWHGTANGSIRSGGSSRLCAPSCGTTSRWTASSKAATPSGKAEKAQPSGAARKQPASSHSGIFQRNSSTNKPTHKKGVLKKRMLCAQLRLKIRHPTYLWDGCVFFLQFSIVLTYKQRKSSQRCHFVERVEEDLLRSNGL